MHIYAYICIYTYICFQITADCPLGDRKGRIFTNSDLTCDTVVASDCYGTTVEAECCETCPSLQNPDLGSDCLYGDKLSAW